MSKSVNKKIILSFFALSVSVLVAKDISTISYRYAVLKEKMPIISTISSKGFSKTPNTKFQMFETRVLETGGTKYYEIEITPKDEIELDTLRTMESDGKIILLDTQKVVFVNGRTEIQSEKVNPEPWDYHIDWTKYKVEASSK